MRDHLTAVRRWAEMKIEGGQEPPWAWYQYMKLIEAIRALEDGMACTISQTESSQQSGEHPEKHLRLVDSTDPQDTAPRHPVGLPVRLPM